MRRVLLLSVSVPLCLNRQSQLLDTLAEPRPLGEQGGKTTATAPRVDRSPNHDHNNQLLHRGHPIVVTQY
jgi:hypothetical protein